MQPQPLPAFSFTKWQSKGIHRHQGDTVDLGKLGASAARSGRRASRFPYP